MIIHIVKNGETLNKILEHYHVLQSDIMSENRHISDFNKLLPGTKIKIPMLSEEIMEELEATEPFIEDYYQTINFSTSPTEVEEELKEEPIMKEIPVKREQEVNRDKDRKYYHNGYMRKI